jgi:hypothetical protein
MPDVQKTDPLDTVVEFYDPTGSVTGAGALFPTPFQQVANELASTRLSLREARERFVQALALMGSGEVHVSESRISIAMPSFEDWKKLKCARHVWTAIRYRPEVVGLEDPFMRELKIRAAALEAAARKKNPNYDRDRERLIKAFSSNRLFR